MPQSELNIEVRVRPSMTWFLAWMWFLLRHINVPPVEVDWYANILIGRGMQIKGSKGWRELREGR
jgi:hypothetical protein